MNGKTTPYNRKIVIKSILSNECNLAMLNKDFVLSFTKIENALFFFD
jgi:hypothetical protein